MVSIRDKRLTLAAATLGAFVALLDSTAVSVALPAVRGDLGGGLQTQQWVVNAYVLTLASLILVGGALGDVFGERRMFVLGAAGFGALSAGCAVAPTVEALIAARALQGVFGALLTPASLAVIVAAFPPDERGKAIATWTAYGGIAALVGPLVGGWLVDALSWRWIFAVNVPFISSRWGSRHGCPRDGDPGCRRRPDWLGGGLCAVGLAGPALRARAPVRPRLGQRAGRRDRLCSARLCSRCSCCGSAAGRMIRCCPSGCSGVPIRLGQRRDGAGLRRAWPVLLRLRRVLAAGGRLRRAQGGRRRGPHDRRALPAIAPSAPWRTVSGRGAFIE